MDIHSQRARGLGQKAGQVSPGSKPHPWEELAEPEAGGTQIFYVSKLDIVSKIASKSDKISKVSLQNDDPIVNAI